MYCFGWFPLVFLFPSPPVSVSIFGDYTKSTNYNWSHRHLSCSIVFFNSRARSSYLSLFSLSFDFTLWSAGTAKSTICKFSFFCSLLLGLLVWPRLGDPFASQNFRGVCVCRSPGQILACVYTMYSYGQISISCTIPSESPFPPSRVESYTLSVLIAALPCLWLIVSSLSPHNLHLLFRSFLSIFVLMWLVLMALFWAAVWSDSISL